MKAHVGGLMRATSLITEKEREGVLVAENMGKWGICMHVGKRFQWTRGNKVQAS